MKIHEYQAKSILKQYNIPIQDGYVIENIDDAEKNISKVKNDFNSKDLVVKAQIHAGGRGKGGGVKLAHGIDDIEKYANEILGMNLVTPQTGPEGQKVQRLLIESASEIERELFSKLFDSCDASEGLSAFIEKRSPVFKGE